MKQTLVDHINRLATFCGQRDINSLTSADLKQQ